MGWLSISDMNMHLLFRYRSGSPVHSFLAAMACAIGWGVSTLRAADLPPPNTLLISGKLKQANLPAQGEHDFRFQLYSSETGGQIPPGSKDVLVTQPVNAGDWQVVLDFRQFGTEAAILDDTIHGGPDLIHPPQSYVGILDDTIRPPQGWVSILDNTVRPPMGSRSILDNTVHTATALNWRAAQGTWLQISVRRKGSGAFVPLTPRQRLTAVPGAVVAQTANHALVAGTVSEGGVDARALAPGAITAEKLSIGAVNNAALANLAVTAPKIAPLTVVRSINGLQDDVTLAAGTGVTLSAAGTTITINSTATGGGGTPLPNGNFLGVNNENTLNSSTNSVIAGGRGNEIRTSTQATVAGGLQNLARGNHAAIGGGGVNTAEYAATVAGGWANKALGPYSTIGGGTYNAVGHNSADPLSGDLTGFEFIGGGQNNTLTNSRSSAIIGGEGNSIENSFGSVIGGGLQGAIDNGSWLSFLGGGSNNRIATNSGYGVIGGGYWNTLTNALMSTIAGGYQNLVEGDYATVGGGSSNFAGPGGAVAGGSGNRAEGANAAVGGGVGNEARSAQATVGGGNHNIVHMSPHGSIAGGFSNSLTNSSAGFIAGGEQNRMLDAADSVIGGGLNNAAGTPYSAILGGEGNQTEGIGGYATVLGGSFNLASGTHSLAAGHRARATHSASFVWNAWPGDVFSSQRDGEFAAKAYGGFRFVTGGEDVGAGDITLDAGNAALRASGKSASFDFGQSFNLTAGGGVNLITGGQGLTVDGQRITAGGGGGNGPITVITGGGQTRPQARIEQTNPDDYVRLMMNTPRSFWTLGTGPNGWFSFYVPGQSPANTSGDNGANRFVITANGEVGVGSQQPFAQFHVRGHGGFDLPQARFTQENPQDFARLRLETGQQAWDIAAGPDGSLRFFGGGADRMVLGADGVQISTGAGGLTVNGRAVAFVDQLGQGGGQPGNGSAVSATVTQGAALTGTSQDAQGGVGVVGTGRVGVQATSASPQGAAVQAIQLNGSGYAGDFAGRVKVSSTLEANGGLRVGGSIRVNGLGDNTPTAAFRLVPELLPLFSAANPGGEPTSFAILDHPSLNGKPDAMLLLTPVNARAYKLFQRTSDVMRGDFLTYFPDTPESPASLRGRWTIDISPTPQGGPVTGAMAVFNALIVTP